MKERGNEIRGGVRTDGAGRPDRATRHGAGAGRGGIRLRDDGGAPALRTAGQLPWTAAPDLCGAVPRAVRLLLVPGRSDAAAGVSDEHPNPAAVADGAGRETGGGAEPAQRRSLPAWCRHKLEPD